MQITSGELSLDWAVSPASWTFDGEVATVTAAGDTDLFRAPDGSLVRDNAARALAVPPEGDWQFSARIAVGFRNKWDAGVLLVWFDEEHWAKACFELSPLGAPTVMSVVTRETSDDAVGWAPAADRLWLQVSRRDGAYYFHASEDGEGWRLARQFALAGPGPVRIGIEAQSPAGDGCTVVFDHLRFTRTRLSEPYDGD